MPIFESVGTPVTAALDCVGKLFEEAADDAVEMEDVETGVNVVAFRFRVVGLPLLINSPRPVSQPAVLSAPDVYSHQLPLSQRVN